MGRGIDLARIDAPEHARAMDEMKDQLIIALVRRLGGSIDMPVAEIDDTGGCLLAMALVDGRTFHFEIRMKQ